MASRSPFYTELPSTIQFPDGTGGAKNVAELVGEQRISIVNEVSHSLEEAVDSVGDVPRNLLHPRTIRLLLDAGDVHTTCLDVDDEQNVVTNQPDPR
jgi:hypothetical protein